jgi:GTP-binding protein LepA
MQKNIRNFSIIAHIDHGKSTLADRMLEYTNTVALRDMREQVLDSMDLERERGITIKAHPVRMDYIHTDGQEYIFDLIDTPGHVDFAYEVSRSLAACEGALLLVDAAQGIEAQTLSTLYSALENNLELIPVINKIDLQSAQVELVRKDLVNLIGCKEEEVLLVSAKENLGIDTVFQAIIDKVPAPKGNPNAPLKALIFDSIYDTYRGAVIYIRVMEGSVQKGDIVRLMATNREYEVLEVGYLKPKRVICEKLLTGEVGFIAANIKQVRDARVGDTVTFTRNPTKEALPGYRDVKPMVFAGFFPADAADYEQLRDGLERLRLNDAAFIYEPDNSVALGFGFRCGFLGLLHMEIVQERLEREYGLNLVTTFPSVAYKLTLSSNEELIMDNPAHFPDMSKIIKMEEPFINAKIIVPTEYVGNVMKLSKDRRGEFGPMNYLDPTRVELEVTMPLSEVIFDFFDKLKSVSRGYASLDYEFEGFRQAKLVKVDIMLNNEAVDALSIIVHEEKSYIWGREMTRKLKDLIPKQLFEVAIQASIGNRVISRTTVQAMRKNVTAKCYGGDITRKRKLLDKQKEGKKRMKTIGSVEVPQEAFLAILSIDRDAVN